MNISKYIKKDMCFQCGACEIGCPVDAIDIQLDKKKGLRLPNINADKCINCKKCLKICPISKIIEPNEENRFIENYIFKSTDKNIFEKGSSSGVVTSIVKYMFDNNLITKAVGIKSINGEAEGVLANDFDGFLKLGGSKYQPATPISALKELKNSDKLVFIGLPCHMKAIKSLIKNKVIKENQIILKIGIFCTIGRGQHGVDYLHDKFKVKPGEVIFREGEHPQNVVINDKKICSYNDFLSYNDYLFYPKACYVCNDLFNVDADIAVGDPWGMNLGKCGATIAHNTKGSNILKECLDNKYLELIKIISKKEMINTQKDSYNFKIKHFKKRISLIVRFLDKLEIEYNGKTERFNKKDIKFCNKLLLMNSVVFNSSIGYKIRCLLPNKILINLYRNRIILRCLHKED